MSEIVSIRISAIDPNPMRRLKDYPFVDSKIETLRQSIADVGLWEGIIGRRKGNRIEIAFGHHRYEAARQELGENAKIDVIVRDLTDEQMLQFMGRENLEDYNADFLVMLETWEAASEFLHHGGGKIEPIEIARLLGWMRYHTGVKQAVTNNTAQACHDASRLIQGGYLKRSQLKDLAVRSVRELCGRIVAQHETLERMAKVTNRPRREIEAAKKISGKAGANVAERVRKGEVAPRNIRAEVDAAAHKKTVQAKKQTPLFGMFAKSLCESIAKVGRSDAIAERLEQVKKSLGQLVMAEDVQTVKRIALECDGAAERFEAWAKVFSNPDKKVVKLKQLGRS